ncbi:MAG: RDD family protein [Chitinophagales bacterium]
MATTTFICKNCGSASYEQFTQTQVRCLNCKKIDEFDTGYRVIPEFQLTKGNDILNIEPVATHVPAPLVKRFLNYIIDIFIISMLYVLFANATNMEIIANNATKLSNQETLILLVFYAVYYIFMEYKFGKTFGKIFTKTKVISLNQNELSFLQCVFRFACRIIPFELLSGLFTKGKFWHDSLPNTMVVDEN